MRQLFFNLLSNAVKFRKKDQQLNISITAEKLEAVEMQSGKDEFLTDYYAIKVSDNGIGFESSYAEDIFVLFKRLHSYHEYNGSGVGLSICKKISEQHNGNLRAFGRLNEGADFILTIPQMQNIPGN